MTDQADWPNILVLARAVLLDLCPDDTQGSHIAPETPPDPNGTFAWLPFIRLTVLGGGDDRVTDTTLLRADCFAATRSAASDLAGTVRQRITATPPPIVAGVGAFDFGATNSKPQNVPQAPGVFLYTATYTVDQRRL